MWIIRWIVSAILVILIIGFAMQNTDVMVPVKFWKWQTSTDLPLWVVMYASFVTGMLFWVVISIIQMVGLRSENRAQKKEVKKLKDELNRLRNVSVEESLITPTQKSLKSGEPKSNKE